MVAAAVMETGAIISPCGLYRTRLWRIWDATLLRVLWIMLNPSTADADANDNTIDTIIAFTKLWGYGGIEVCNAYAYRTKSPALLKAAHYPNDPGNGAVLREMMTDKKTGLVMAAWGNHIQPRRALDIRVDAQILDIPLFHLGLNKNGSPKHPLYVRRDTWRQELVVPL